MELSSLLNKRPRNLGSLLTQSRLLTCGLSSRLIPEPQAAMHMHQRRLQSGRRCTIGMTHAIHPDEAIDQ